MLQKKLGKNLFLAFFKPCILEKKQSFNKKVPTLHYTYDIGLKNIKINPKSNFFIHIKNTIHIESCT